MPAILTLSLRALAGRKRLLVLALLIAVPAVLAFIYSFSSSTDAGTVFAVRLFNDLFLPVIMPLTALVVAVSALGHEVEDQTLIYLMLRPVTRSAIVLAKYLAAAILVIAFVEVSLALACELGARKAASLPSGSPPELKMLLPTYDTGNALASMLLAGFGGCIAYVGLFLLVGLLLPQRGLLVGFAYILGWEVLIAGRSTALATFSIRYYVQGLLDTHLDNAELARLVPSTLSAFGSVVGLFVISIAAFSLTTAALRRVQSSET